MRRKYKEQRMIGFRMEKEILKEFKQICFENQDTMTDIVNKSIKAYIKNNKSNNV